MDIRDDRHFKTLWKWVLLSCIIGPSTALVVKGFMYALPLVTIAAEKAFSFSPYLIPIAGGLLCGLFILRSVPGAGGEGIPSYLYAINQAHGLISLRDTILKIPATILTLGFYSSGGIVGPMCRIGAGIGCHLTRWVFRFLHMEERGILRTATICGVSGIISSIFHSPLGGAIFAVEILFLNSLRYRDLFPAILTGCVSYMTSAFLLNEEALFLIPAPPAPTGGATYLWLPLMAFLAGAIGFLFIITYKYIAEVFRKMPFGQPAKACIAGTIMSLLWLTGQRSILGTSPSLFSCLASGDLTSFKALFPEMENLYLLISSVIVLKIFSTSVTIGSRMSGGFTGPVLLIGLAGGALVSSLTGVAPGSPEYYMFAACSVAAALSATLNIPLAAIVISTGLFGNDYLLPTCIGAVTSFIIFKKKTIYSYSIVRPSENSDLGQTASQT